MENKIIIFSPHPDDETFGCGGTIAKRLNEGCSVLVIIMTNGKQAYYKIPNIDKILTTEDFIKIRKKELMNALEILGLKKENIIFLNFEDSALKHSSREVEKRVIKILKEFSPTEVYCSYEKDFHPDHVVASFIVRNALKKISLPRIKCYEYSISHKYSYIIQKLDVLVNSLRNKIFKVNVSNYIPLKKKAIDEFKSQISIITEKQKRPIIKNVKKFLKDEELFFIK